MYRSKTSLLILAALSLAVGIIVHSMVRYKPATLLLEAKTMEQGFGRVFVESAASNSTTSKEFEVSDDQEGQSQYVIELPSTILKSIRIAPLARPGYFEIQRIVLSGDAMSYSWDEQGKCLQTILSPRILWSEQCSDAAPNLMTTDDSSIIISSIPDIGYNNKTWFRVGLACIVTAGLFLGGIWLTRPVNRVPRNERLQHYFSRIAILVLIFLYAFQFYLVWQYAVDAPFSDEWYYFKPDALPQGLTWKWLFSPHYPHRIVPTKLLAWLNLKLFDMDFVIGKIFNYIIFGALIFSILRAKKCMVGNRFILFPMTLFFLMSPIAYENHLWGFQSQIHLVLLFSTVSLCFAYHAETTYKSSLLFCLFTAFGIYSFLAGVVFALVFLCCSTIYFAGNSGSNGLGNKSWRILFINWGIIGTSLVFWFVGYKNINISPQTLPSVFEYLDFFLNIVSLGFGIKTHSALLGIACLAIATFPLAVLVKNNEARWQPSTWHVLTAITGILAALASITMGRITLADPKMSRYAEISFILIPYTSIAWWLVLKEKMYRTVGLTFLWLFCFFAYLDDWSTEIYPKWKQLDVEFLKSIANYNHGYASDQKPVLTSNVNLAEVKRLKVNFTKGF